MIYFDRMTSLVLLPQQNRTVSHFQEVKLYSFLHEVYAQMTKIVRRSIKQMSPHIDRMSAEQRAALN